MELVKDDKNLEELNKKLNDDHFLYEYKNVYDNYTTSLLTRFFFRGLIRLGNIIYGLEPSYLKFRALEIVARAPYQSWSSAIYTLITFCFNNEKKALQLSQKNNYPRIAHDNETMHVIVISQILKNENIKINFLDHTVIPMLFAFLYYISSFILYLVYSKGSYELNYLFETHAFHQYDRFINMHKDSLLEKKVESDFLNWYGRKFNNQYEFFLSIRNDELIHRNRSIEEMLN